MEEIEVGKLTEEQLAKLKKVMEFENPKPRNRAERREQERQNRRKSKWKKTKNFKSKF